VDADGRFDLVIHLHGHEPARKELVRSGARFVFVGISLEPGKSFGSLFSGSGLFEQLVTNVEASLAKRIGRPATADRIAVTAWSAGYEGVQALLAQASAERIHAVFLIDGLHARREPASMRHNLLPFIEYARRAARGERLFAITHSSIDPPSFASTTETAHHVIAALGGVPQRVSRPGPMGLELVEFFSLGDFHVRGYAGNDKADHCAQFGAYGELIGVLSTRWKRRR
jgi:hypothetical protein